MSEIHGHSPKVQPTAAPKSFDRAGLEASEVVECFLGSKLKVTQEKWNTLVEAYQPTLKRRKTTDIGQGGHSQQGIDGAITTKVEKKSRAIFAKAYTNFAHNNGGMNKKAKHVPRAP